MENKVYYSAVILGTILFCVSVVLLLKKPFFRLSTSSVKQLDIILNSSLGEKEKDNLLFKSLLRLLLNLFTAILLFIITVLFGLIPVMILYAFEPELNIDTSSVYFYLSMVLGSFSLFLFKNSKKTDYSYWSKLLHTIILENYNIGKHLFNKELNKVDEEKSKNSPFVIVSGLARAGTTALTKLLYNPDTFHSIKYSNMPFLLAPNLWKKFYNPKLATERERAHGDKVFFSENSIEALEEYFFKAFLNDKYINTDSLSKHEINYELYNNYLSYQRLFKNKQKENTIYLAKNNNFILRYESMRSLDNNFNVIVVFRDPFEHANSLLLQHRKFVLKQSEDTFTLSYMNWLGHHEFGLNQKYFELYEKNIEMDFEKDSLNYWIAMWINYYSYILKFLDDPKLFIVHYDDLVKKPSELKQAIGDCLNIHFEYEHRNQFIPKKYSYDSDNIDDKLIRRAREIYKELKYNKKK